MPIKKTYIDFIPQSSAPAGVEGRIYYDSTLKKLRYYDGSKWVDLG